MSCKKWTLLIMEDDKAPDERDLSICPNCVVWCEGCLEPFCPETRLEEKTKPQELPSMASVPKPTQEEGFKAQPQPQTPEEDSEEQISSLVTHAVVSNLQIHLGEAAVSEVKPALGEVVRSLVRDKMAKSGCKLATSKVGKKKTYSKSKAQCRNKWGWGWGRAG